MVDVHEFTLRDRNGTPHNYSTRLLDAGTDGMRVIEGLLSIGLAPLIQALLTASQKGDMTEMEIDVEAIQKQLMAGALRSMVPVILKGTYRDGARLSENNNLAAYNGNYGEMLQAVQKVVELNGFFQVLSTFTDGDGE